MKNIIEIDVPTQGALHSTLSEYESKGYRITKIKSNPAYTVTFEKKVVDRAEGS